MVSTRLTSISERSPDLKGIATRTAKDACDVGVGRSLFVGVGVDRPGEAVGVFDVFHYEVAREGLKEKETL